MSEPKLETQIVRNLIIGILSFVGVGVVSIGVWTIKTVLRHDTMLALMTQTLQDMQLDVTEIRKVVNKL